MKEELRKETEVLKQSNICGRDENQCQLSKKIKTQQKNQQWTQISITKT